MKKKNVIVLLVVVLLVLIAGTLFLLFKNNGDNNTYSNIVIVQYAAGSNNKIKTINIDSENDIKKVSKYVNKVDKSVDKEKPKLDMLKEIEIQCDGDVIVGIQLDEKKYCYYKNKEKNISTTAKMPNGLYEFVVEKIK